MWRVRLTKIFFLLATVVLAGRLAQIMVFSHRDYQVLAEQQHFANITLPAQRGTIYSADGFALATNEEAYLVWASPAEIGARKSAEEIAEKLAPLLLPYFPTPSPVEETPDTQDRQEKLQDELAASLSREDTFYVPLAHKVSVETRDKIAELELPGIYADPEPKRAYPESSLAAQVLGFVGKNSQGQDQGYFGLEGYYHGDLSGTPGGVILERGALGKPIPMGALKRIEPEDGRDLVLTLRRELQYLIEKKLAEGVKKYDAEHGEVILMNPENGAILAMAGFPSYNPENWTRELEGETDVSKVGIFSNKAISDNYEPGSVLKSFTMSSALNADVVTPATTYQDNGPVEYSGHLVRTWDNQYHDKINMAELLQLSNNTGAAWVGHKLGFDRFAKYLKKFRLGEKLGVDLQGEDSGIVRDESGWRDIDLATMSFGQGISVTPIQLSTIVSTIANDGVMMRPHVVREIRNGRQGQAIKIDPEVLGQPINKETAREMQQMLKSVVEEGEFNWFVKDAGLENFSIAGKTGTAQIPVNGEYDPNKTNVTFVGFAPAEDPKFVMLVRLHKPTASTFSADTAVPLWLDIAKDLFLYFNIAPK